ncbi:MAG TPA: ATP-binding protein [Polyangiaceae bacterium]|nr:ATP-binding protein [Polyangiaceae bacterium]
MVAAPTSQDLDVGHESRAPLSSAAERQYVEMTKRLTRVTGGGAAAISVLVMLSCRDEPRAVAILLGILALQVPFNLWVNLRLLQRVGAERGELIRNTVNVVAALGTGHVAHWQASVYVWLPYIALAFEQNGSRYATWALASICVAFDGLGLLEGVPWMRPLAGTVLAVLCARIARVRVQEMTRMLVEGDLQRRQLERAHDAMKIAHERLTRETQARELAEIELRQAQKLEAVGRLAAGLAHEINTPAQFVGDNLRFTKDAVTELKAVLVVYRSLSSAVGAEAIARCREEARRADRAADVEYLLEELPAAVDKSLEGVARISDIVRSMKEFAKPDQKQMVAVDLNAAASDVLTVARSEYAGVAKVEFLAGALPPVVCHAGEINQVILNLVVNAAEAISEVAKSGEAGHIVVATSLEADRRHVVLSITDDGAGIPQAIRGRIFEPFFTTKPVGKGTGQGLAVSRAVVQRHGGTITFESTEGAGTTSASGCRSTKVSRRARRVSSCKRIANR